MADDATIDKGAPVDKTAAVGTVAPVWRDRVPAWARRGGVLAYDAAAEILTVFAALAVLGLYAANTLLTRQSSDLSAFRPTINRFIAQSFDGADTRIEQLDLRWFPSRDSVVFTARGVDVLDRDGQTVQSLERLRAGLHVDGLRQRRPDLRDVEVVGGEVTWLERADGSIIAGLGKPDTVGAFGPVYRGIGDTPPSQGPDWLEAFERVDIRNSRVNIVNETNGLDLVLAVDELSGRRDGKAVALDVDGRVAGETDGGRVALSLRSPDALNTLTLTANLEGVRPDVIAPPDGRFAVIRAARLPVDASGSGIYSRKEGLQAVKADIRVGEGTVGIGGQARSLRSLNVTADLDLGGAVMTLSDISLDSDRLMLSGSGVLSELGKLSDGDVGTSPRFDMDFDRARLDLTPAFADALDFQGLEAAGRLDLDSRSLALDRVEASLGTVSILGDAFVQTADTGLSRLKLSGRTDGPMSPDQLLSLWPVNAADGARRWIERSVLSGSLDTAEFNIDLDPDFFAEPVLTPERLQLTFDVSDGEVRYISTMTPLTRAKARGRIDGNSLSLELSEALIGDVVVTEGTVDIPRLTPKGGDILIAAEANAPTQSLLGLVNQPPFQYLDRYGVATDGFGGQGRMSLTVKRPLLENFDRDRIEYAVEGTFEDASAPFEIGGFRLTDADVRFKGGKAGLFLRGPADLGPWRAQIDWAERYGQNGEPTRYSVNGVMDQATLDAFGLGSRQILGGEVGVSLDAVGQGVNVRDAELRLDLTGADITIGDIWSKLSGESGALEATLAVSDAGYSAPRFLMRGPGLAIEGEVDFREDLALRSARLARLDVDGLIKGRADVARTTLTSGAEGFSFDVGGDWLDISDFVRSGLRQQGEPTGLPIQIEAEFGNVILADDYALEAAAFEYLHDGEVIQGLSLTGRRPDGALAAEIRTEDETGIRKANVRVPDMSQALSAVYGLSATRGGTLRLDADLPPGGTPGATIGRVEMEDFTVENAPFLAQMLSLASLTGLFDTLSGGGLAFDGLEFDFALREGSLSVRDAKMSGPALGMTGEGEVSFDKQALDFGGALVPAYTANSLLGDIPLIGDVFVGKDGEGVFALTYTVSGPFSGAQIAVNPLSALTPGFLRGIFSKKREDLPEGVTEEFAAQIESVRPESDD